jgi:hypothetical protein
VLVKPGESRGSFGVELEGEIAAMMELAQGANIKKGAQEAATVPDDGAPPETRVKLVLRPFARPVTPAFNGCGSASQ